MANNKTRRLRSLGIPLAALALLGVIDAAAGVPTRVRVRAVSRNATILASEVGGARITIRDAGSGAVLAEGFQEGHSGDTRRIMQPCREPGEPVYDTEGAAAFDAVLDLERPTEVEITAEGPLGFPQATRRASKHLLLVPGEHVLGDGVLLEIHGFIVDLIAPHDAGVPYAGLPVKAGVPLHVRTTVRMACGCPTEPDGPWNASGIRVSALLTRGDAVLAETPLRYAGQQSTFAGTLPAVPPGPAELVVLAADADAANFGEARLKLDIGEASPE